MTFLSVNRLSYICQRESSFPPCLLDQVSSRLVDVLALGVPLLASRRFLRSGEIDQALLKESPESARSHALAI